MPIKTLVPALFLAFPLAAIAQEPSEPKPAQNEAATQQSQFVGRYDGNSFETAMGMIVRDDGTFQWGISVGSLDLRAQGTWVEQGNTIAFTSAPKPVPPQFTWSGLERSDAGPFLRIVWAGTGNPFQYASVRGICANGTMMLGTVLGEGWSPGEDCDTLESVQFRLQSYDVASERFELVDERTVEAGQTIRFEFHRNDLGVADFSGVTGQLEAGELRLEGGALGSMTLRKIAPPAQEPTEEQAQ